MSHLIHVVPDKERRRRILSISARPTRPLYPAYLPNLEAEHTSPPVPAVWVKKVNPHRASGPAPAFEIRAVRSFNHDVEVLRILVDPERFGLLDVGIDDGNHLHL